jgi:hypothetical protein
MVRLLHLELLAASPAEVHTIKERVMAKVIEFYVTEELSECVRACRSAPTGNGYRVFFAGKEVSPDSTSWRGARVAPRSGGVEPCRRK